MTPTSDSTRMLLLAPAISESCKRHGARTGPLARRLELRYCVATMPTDTESPTAFFDEHGRYGQQDT